MYRYLNSVHGPCRPRTTNEFASHILIPLSIVKQRIACSESRFRDSLESYSNPNHQSRATSAEIYLPFVVSHPRRAPVIRLDLLEVPLSATTRCREPRAFAGSRGEYRATQRSTRAGQRRRHTEPPQPNPPKCQRGTRNSGPPAVHAPSRNRTENLLIKSQLL